MNGVMFNNLHSYDDFKLILTSKTIEAPTIKTNIIDVPGSNGSIDLSDCFGDVYYTNRLITFEFATIVNQNDFLTLFTELQNLLHGKVMKIILDDDMDYYYRGRVIVNEWKSNKRIGVITIEVDAEPYKYKLYETKYNKTINGTEELILLNGRKRVVPIITTTSDVELTFNNKLYTLKPGTYTDINIPDFILERGSNIIKVKGNTTLSISYQEGDL